MTDYSLMTDEEVISVAHSKDDIYAQEYILNKYRPLVRKCTRGFYITGADSEDLNQEAMIGLYKALRDYSTDKGAKFSTFAKICIDRQIKTAIKTAERQKHKILNEAIYLSDPTPTKNNLSDVEKTENYMDIIADKQAKNPADIIMHDEESRSLLKEIEESLSTLELKVLKLYMQGISYTRIAAIMSRDEKSIDNTLQRIRKKVTRLVDGKTK